MTSNHPFTLAKTNMSAIILAILIYQPQFLGIAVYFVEH